VLKQPSRHRASLLSLVRQLLSECFSGSPSSSSGGVFFFFLSFCLFFFQSPPLSLYTTTRLTRVTSFWYREKPIHEFSPNVSCIQKLVKYCALNFYQQTNITKTMIEFHLNYSVWLLLPFKFKPIPVLCWSNIFDFLRFRTFLALTLTIAI
jgi:hypothetical protein